MLLLLSFWFAKNERSKEKGDFEPIAPLAQKGATPVSQFFYHRHGAGFIPMPNAIGLPFRILLLVPIWLHQSYLRKKKAPSILVVAASIIRCRLENITLWVIFLIFVNSLIIR